MNREEKKKVTRSKLLQSSYELFAEQGYEATTIAQITERAGVAKGTFFNYFLSKENVLAQLKTNITVEEALRLLKEPGPLTPHLYLLVHRLTEHLEGPRPLTLAIFQGVIGKTSAVERQNEQIAEMKGAIVPLIQEGQRRGEFRSDLDPADMADMAVQTFFGALLYWGMGHGDEELARHMVHSFDYFFYRILAQQP